MSSSILPFITDPLYKALDRWQEAWELKKKQLYQQPSQSWQAYGFMQHAEEFAGLAKIHLDRAHLSTGQWHDLVQNLSDSLSTGHQDGLSKLDQTSMSQVADLMLGLERLNFD